MGAASARTFGSTLQKPFQPGGMDSIRKASANVSSAANADVSTLPVAEDVVINTALFTGELPQVSSGHAVVYIKFSQVIAYT